MPGCSDESRPPTWCLVLGASTTNCGCTRRVDYPPGYDGDSKPPKKNIWKAAHAKIDSTTRAANAQLGTPLALSQRKIGPSESSFRMPDLRLPPFAHQSTSFLIGVLPYEVEASFRARLHTGVKQRRNG